MSTFSRKPITNEEIKELLLGDDTCKEIADAFGISWQRVAAIKGALLKFRQDPDKRASITRSHHP